MARLAAVEDGLAAQGRLGPVARLMPTARDLARANDDGAGVYEIRPLALFRPGVAAGVTDVLSDTTPSPAG
ncbi:hypothetical protein WG926_20110 [Tistrella sp. BH-R2-4]|jgi:hypothetical protein|uniref:Uncharacterized protein n=1 Tax=Tistrella arctica TaxID=3133430 RepID=A0ABU9YPA0_9PROT